jgi:hypothetical protein
LRGTGFLSFAYQTNTGRTDSKGCQPVAAQALKSSDLLAMWVFVVTQAARRAADPSLDRKHRQQQEPCPPFAASGWRSVRRSPQKVVIHFCNRLSLNILLSNHCLASACDILLPVPEPWRSSCAVPGLCPPMHSAL